MKILPSFCQKRISYRFEMTGQWINNFWGWIVAFRWKHSLPKNVNSAIIYLLSRCSQNLCDFLLLWNTKGAIPLASEDLRRIDSTLWAFKGLSIINLSLLSLYRNKKLGHLAKYLLLCSIEENLLGLERVNNDIIYIFGFNKPRVSYHDGLVSMHVISKP